jgi:hypothetical protein
LILDECFSIDLFCDLNQQLLPPVAFALISQAVEISLDQDNAYLFTAALSLVAGLVEKSNTTEMPESLIQCWEELRERAEQYAPTTNVTWQYLKSWYRR